MSTKTQQEIYDAERNPSQPDNILNPGQDDYDRKFNDITRSPDMQALDDQGNAAIRDHEQRNRPETADDSRQAAAEGERRVGDTAAGKALSTAADMSGNTAAKIAARVASQLKTRKGGLAGLVVLIVAGILIAAGFLAPSLLLVHLKEEGLSWTTKYTNLGMNNRIRLTYTAKIFGNPDNCKGPKALCRFYPGMKDSDIEALRKQGFKIDEGDIGGKGNKKFVKKMTMSVDGKPVVVTQKNLAKLHATNPKVQSAMNNYIRGRSITHRSLGALKKFSIFNIDRAKPLGEKFTKKGMLTYFREKFYEGKHNLASKLKPGSDENSGDARKNNLAKLADIEAEAAAVRGTNIVENGPKAIVPDTSALKLENAAKIGAGTLSGGLKGVVMGWLNTFDTVCSIYNTIRIVNFGVKALAAAQLIKYAGMFTTIADKQKVSSADMAEIAFLASILLAPSRMEASKGKDFSQSQGANLMFYGKITNQDSLHRFSLGSAASQATDIIFSIASLKGLSGEACSRILSKWGQAGLFVGGIITSLLTLGTGAVKGAAEGAVKGFIIGTILQILTPRLIPLIAGTLIPDPRTDPEGGYGAGNAIAAGLGAFGGQLGRAQGMRPLKKTQHALLRNSQEYRVMAQADELDKQSGGSFNLDNPYSIPNKVALSLYQLGQPKSSLSEYIASVDTTIRSAITKPVTQTASASVDDEYGGQYCADDQFASVMKAGLEVDLAKDANCNIIYGPDPAIVLSPDDITRDVETVDTQPGVSRDVKYGINDTFYWMAEHGYINPETGDSRKEYTEYKETCMEGTDPILDKWSADLGDGTDMSKCYKLDGDGNEKDKYRYFSAWSIHESIRESTEAISDNKLGIADASSAGGGNVTIVPGTLPAGSAQDIAKQLLQYTANGTISCNRQARNCPDITNTAEGKPLGGNCPAGMTLDARVLGTILVLTQKGYKLTLSSLCSDHDIDNGGHPKGKAFDINFINGVWIGNGSASGYWGPSTQWGPLTEKVTQEIVAVGAKNKVGIGQIQCHPKWSFLDGVNTFVDDCHHIHVEYP